MQQVPKQAYAFERYAYPGRWVSYYHQLRCALACAPSSLLEIGIGDGVFGSYIKQNTAVHYRSLDIAPDLHPDIVGSVTQIPLPDDSVDIVCAFEILEHLPFDRLDIAVSEMMRVARSHVLISVPQYGPACACSVKLPLLPVLRWAFKIPFPLTHRFNGQHHWEIGKRGYSRRTVRRILARHGIIEREFIPFENQYHRFYILRKRSFS